MSKIKKKRIVSPSAISVLDIKFEKIIQFSGWLFLLGLVGFFGAWLLLDTILEIFNFELESWTFAVIIFTGTNSAISFGLATKLKNNRDKKRQYFLDWLVGEFLFCMLAIFTISVYIW